MQSIPEIRAHSPPTGGAGHVSTPRDFSQPPAETIQHNICPPISHPSTLSPSDPSFRLYSISPSPQPASFEARSLSPSHMQRSRPLPMHGINDLLNTNPLPQNDRNSLQNRSLFTFGAQSFNSCYNISFTKSYTENVYQRVTPSFSDDHRARRYTDHSTILSPSRHASYGRDATALAQSPILRYQEHISSDSNHIHEKRREVGEIHYDSDIWAGDRTGGESEEHRAGDAYGGDWPSA